MRDTYLGAGLPTLVTGLHRLTHTYKHETSEIGYFFTPGAAMRSLTASLARHDDTRTQAENLHWTPRSEDGLNYLSAGDDDVQYALHPITANVSFSPEQTTLYNLAAQQVTTNARMMDLHGSAHHPQLSQQDLCAQTLQYVQFCIEASSNAEETETLLRVAALQLTAAAHAVRLGLADAPPHTP